MCSGRIDLAFILRAFQLGLDGVFIGSCHLNECNYLTHGNFHALSTVHLLKKLMGHIGINPDRLRIEWMSASEGVRFAEVMNDISKTILKLGPLGKSERLDRDTLKLKLEAAVKLVPYLRLVERERLRIRFKTEEEYQTFFNSKEFGKLFNEMVVDKMVISQIMLLLENKSLSTGEISEALGLNPSEVSRHLNSSSRQGLVRYDVDQRRYSQA